MLIYCHISGVLHSWNAMNMGWSPSAESHLLPYQWNNIRASIQHQKKTTKKIKKKAKIINIIPPLTSPATTIQVFKQFHKYYHQQKNSVLKKYLIQINGTFVIKSMLKFQFVYSTESEFNNVLMQFPSNKATMHAACFMLHVFSYSKACYYQVIEYFSLTLLRLEQWII